MPITNPELSSYPFLLQMYEEDDFYPGFIVDKCKDIFVHLCEQIENEQPTDLDTVFRLTHAAVDAVNRVQSEFEELDGGGFDTLSREILLENFDAVLQAYGFGDADLEEAVSNRDW